MEKLTNKKLYNNYNGTLQAIKEALDSYMEIFITRQEKDGDKLYEDETNTLINGALEDSTFEWFWKKYKLSFESNNLLMEFIFGCYYPNIELDKGLEYGKRYYEAIR